MVNGLSFLTTFQTILEKTGSHWFVILQLESQLWNGIQTDFDNEM